MIKSVLLKASFTSGSLFLLGDIASQYIQFTNKKLDSKEQFPLQFQLNLNQSLQFGCIGCFLHGPYFLKAFRLLDSQKVLSFNFSKYKVINTFGKALGNILQRNVSYKM